MPERALTKINTHDVQSNPTCPLLLIRCAGTWDAKEKVREEGDAKEKVREEGEADFKKGAVRVDARDTNGPVPFQNYCLPIPRAQGDARRAT